MINLGFSRQPAQNILSQKPYCKRENHTAHQVSAVIGPNMAARCPRRGIRSNLNRQPEFTNNKTTNQTTGDLFVFSDLGHFLKPNFQNQAILSLNLPPSLFIFAIFIFLFSDKAIFIALLSVSLILLGKVLLFPFKIKLDISIEKESMATSLSLTLSAIPLSSSSYLKASGSSNSAFFNSPKHLRFTPLGFSRISK